VAEDVVEAVRDPDAPASRSWYLPTTVGTDYDYAAITIVARGATERTAAAMRTTLARIDPELAWYNLEPMETRLAESVSRERLGSFLFSLFALCAVATALCGLYGTLAFVAETCRHEFGVRFALGARPGQVLSAQLLGALRLAAIGIGGGLLLALPLILLVGAYVYGVSLHDAWAVPLLGIAMLALAVLASLAPACRASRVLPMEALRDA
jgi:ABC-type antimicrobial peptide transport system permease subunit